MDALIKRDRIADPIAHANNNTREIRYGIESEFVAIQRQHAERRPFQCVKCRDPVHNSQFAVRNPESRIQNPESSIQNPECTIEKMAKNEWDDDASNDANDDSVRVAAAESRSRSEARVGGCAELQ